MLRELLDLAVVGVRDRVAEALAECATAREHSLLAESESSARLDEVIRTFKDPNAEHLVRQAARAQTLRAGKSCSKLRAAMELLEQEVANMQSVHVADVRSHASRLVAQRDAHVSMLVAELRAAEVEGEVSLRALLEQNRRLSEERDATVAALEAALEAEREGVRARDIAISILGKEIGAGDDASAGLEGDLRRARREVTIVAQLLAEEEAAGEATQRRLEVAAELAAEERVIDEAVRLRVLGEEFAVEEKRRRAEARAHAIKAAQNAAQQVSEIN